MKSMSIQKISLNSIVTKSNELVPHMSRYSLAELRLIAYCVAHFDSRKPENPLCVAKVTDLAEIFAIAETSAYSYIKSLVQTLKPYEDVNDEEEAVNIFWFKGFRYSPKKGEITFMINDLMTKHLLDLRQNFSSYTLKDVHDFKSALTWHLFENINKWKNAGIWNVSIDDLRIMLNIKDKYQRFDSLRQYVIDPAILEINEKSSLNVEYIKERTGRIVTALRFFIENKSENIDAIDIRQNRLLKIILNCGLKIRAAENLTEKIKLKNLESHFIKKIPEMKKRWSEDKGELPRYVAGAIKLELNKNIQIVENQQPEHIPSMHCWLAKKRSKIICKVRERGIAYRTKCKICLQRINVKTFGI